MVPDNPYSNKYVRTFHLTSCLGLVCVEELKTLLPELYNAPKCTQYNVFVRAQATRACTQSMQDYADDGACEGFKHVGRLEISTDREIEPVHILKQSPVPKIHHVWGGQQ